MRIGYYNHTSVISGAEISLVTMASHLQEAVPVLLAPEGELADRVRELGLEYYEVPGYRARMTKNPFALLKHAAGMLREGWRVSRLIEERSIDIVHANSIRAGLMVSLFRWKHRRPIIWHIRDNPPGGLIGRMIRRFGARSADAWICISEAVREGTGDSNGKLARVIHNGVKADFADSEEKQSHRTRIRQELGTSAEVKVLAVIGQIAPWKRQEDALLAAARLLEKGHDLEVWIVGEPKFREENTLYEKRLRELASSPKLKGKIRFTGFRNDIKEICCSADLLVLCSDNEPFGRVLIEAMAQGIPVVATRAGGVPEVVDDEKCGLLYEVGDTEGLMACADRLLSDDSLMEEYGRNAREHVRKNFVIDRTVEKVERIYRSLLKPGIRTAIVHDYLNQRGGAERVVGTFHKMFPDAPIFTTIADRSELLPELEDADIRTTWMQRIPGILKKFKLFFWLYPAAIRSIDLKGYDLIISSSSAYAKGIRKAKGAVHVCYCHTPMRFAWNFDDYIDGMGVSPLVKKAAFSFVPALKHWDRRRSSDIDELVANSSVVQERILDCYGRSSSVIYPPVDLSRFKAEKVAETGDYYLVVSRLVSYKRIDIAVEACTLLSQKLIVVGQGPDRNRLEQLGGPTITFTGRLQDKEVERLMRGCRALIFPGVEDFGITPLEVNACGRPVIAYREGGALDTIMPGVNGLFFEEQTAASLEAALLDFPRSHWNSEAIRAHAEKFGEERFEREIREAVRSAMHGRGKQSSAVDPLHIERSKASAKGLSV